jgi:protein O-GlcNAc transferase
MNHNEDAKNFFFAGLEAFSKNQFEHAETSFLNSLSRVPDRVSVLTNLAAVQIRLEKFASALSYAKKAIALDPKNIEGFLNAGVANNRLGQNHQAIGFYDKAIELDANYADAWCNRGISFKDIGYFSEAERDLETAISINPEHTEALTNLGNVLSLTDRYAEAEEKHRLAISVYPEFADTDANSGNNLNVQGRLAEGEANLVRVNAPQPRLAAAHNNLGGVLSNMGRIPEALRSYLEAVRLNPSQYQAHSDALFSYNYLRDFSIDRYLQEARRFGSFVSDRAKPKFTSWRTRRFGESIRVGFVSGDLREHAVAYFVEGLIKNLDLERIELLAFPTRNKSDDLTDRIRPFFTKWISVVGESDFDAAKIIHEQGVDVLIDLSGHTGFNRLPVFSYKPAPIQATWLGYFASTGLPEIDYFIGDPHVSPAGDNECFTEDVWNLPDTWFCFTTPKMAIDTQPPPVHKNGYITFGNFGNLIKVNDDVIDVWAQVLSGVPESKIFLKSKQLADKNIGDMIRNKFVTRGIGSDRLIFEGRSSRDNYLKAYNKIDIVLDTFPYPGGTTSNEALWMGVPILTLKGDRFLSRLGYSINTNADLPQWVAADKSEYVKKAVTFASDQKMLTEFRSEARARVLATPLFDQVRFARNFENMIRDMCDKHKV